MPPDTSPSRSSSSLGAIVLAFAAVYVVWGTTFFAIKLTLRSMPAFLSGTLRFALAGGVMYLWLRAREPRPFKGLNFAGTVLCGVLLTGMGNGFLIWAQTALPSGITALFVGSLPVWILVLDWAFFSRRRPRALGALGVAFGFAGIAVLSLSSESLSGAVRPIHVLAVLGAELSWALGMLLQPRYVAPARVASFTCLQMLIGAGFQALISLISGEWTGFAPGHVTLQSWLALLYLVLAGSLIAFNCYAFLVAHVAPQKVATYALVNPLIALALGATLLGERITAAAAISTALVLIGVGLVLLQAGSTRPAARAPLTPASAGNPKS